MLTQDQVQAELAGKRLVFLVGAPRSGTTWLQLLLSRSPSVVTAQETDLFNIFLRPLVDEWNRYRTTGVPIGLTEVLSEHDFRSLLRSASGFVLAKIAQAKPSAAVVLEKTPNHINCWREILALWPEAHFVHIIRDPRSVVASRRAAVKSWWSEHDWGPSRISAIARKWVADVEDGCRIGSATENYQEVSFEELTLDGPNVIWRILEKLGVPSNLEECQKYVRDCSIEKLKAGELTNAPFDIGKAGKYRFRTGTTKGWKTELSPWEVALVERLAGPLMSKLRFTPVSRGNLMAPLLDVFCTVRDARGVAREWLQFLARHC